MYNSRQRQFQQQTLQAEEVQSIVSPSVTGSILTSVPPTSASVSPSARPSAPATRTQSVKATTYYADDFAVLEEAKVDKKTKDAIPKTARFEPLSDLALKHFRELLTKEYRETLNAMIQETEGVNEFNLRPMLQPVVVMIDRKLRQLKFPGTVDAHLFHIELETMLEALRAELDARYLDLAQTIGIKIRNHRQLLSEEQEELRQWKEKNEKARKVMVKSDMDL
ncbi:hypothetical protein BY458DRAFT_554717 [Sporodiniella umbellata]|nr:hypothetical protein BY458DRAFT_554717 [Sporodiniella umbellata]